MIKNILFTCYVTSGFSLEVATSNPNKEKREIESSVSPRLREICAENNNK